jgi:hypothetical protein
MGDSIIEALQKYFLGCPLISDGRLGVDYLPEHGVAYSLDTTPASEIIQQYIDGGSLRQYLFVFRSAKDYGPDTLQNMANSGLFEALAAWMERQTRARNLPVLPEGLLPRRIEAQSTGYLFTSSPDTGKYQIQCRLIYYRKGGR